MVERPVARRIHHLEWLAHEAEEHGAPLDADDLRGHAHPRHAFAEQLDMPLNPIGRGIDAAAHIQPLNDDRAAERLRVRWSVNENAGLVGRRLARRDGPPAVRPERCTVDVGARRARNEVLRLFVADLCKVERRRGNERGPGVRDRALDARARYLGARTGGQCHGTGAHERGEGRSRRHAQSSGLEVDSSTDLPMKTGGSR